MANETILNRLLNTNSKQDWNVTQLVLEDAWKEIASLRIAIDRVVEAIENEGPNPKWHRRILYTHRTQWPYLWKCLDMLQDEARRG